MLYRSVNPRPSIGAAEVCFSELLSSNDGRSCIIYLHVYYLVCGEALVACNKASSKGGRKRLREGKDDVSLLVVDMKKVGSTSHVKMTQPLEAANCDT